jgi:hypothetical protein
MKKRDLMKARDGRAADIGRVVSLLLIAILSGFVVAQLSEHLWTTVASGVVLILVMAVAFIWTFRRNKVACPHCRRSLQRGWPIGLAIATGKCGYCGESVLDVDGDDDSQGPDAARGETHSARETSDASDAERPPTKVFVGGLSNDTKDEDLRAAFAEYGTPTSVSVVTDRDTGLSRGFGFVEFASVEEASMAIEGMNGKELQGRTLNVAEARGRESGGRRGRGRRSRQ